MKKFDPINNEDGMKTLCRMITEVEFEDLPSHVTDFAKKHILDTMGVTIAGSAEEGIKEVVEFVKEQGDFLHTSVAKGMISRLIPEQGNHGGTQFFLNHLIYRNLRDIGKINGNCFLGCLLYFPTLARKAYDG